MNVLNVLSPLFRISLRLILPLALVVGSGCQMVRSAHSGAVSAYDAEFAMRIDIMQEAAGYIGSRYKYSGVSPSTGFDCSGFTSFILAKYDISLPHQSGSQAQQGRPVPLDRVMPGDIVYFSRKSRIFHVALVESNDADGITVIHSTTSRGVIRENITRSDYWRPKIAGARSVVDAVGFAGR
jgi:hypothetical protein